ncbi:T9SS type A sorting domain-containing protein [Flavobacterium soyangense]|uniref:T9SS type A sorting domain-containing protein n=1 Tax=Flavobacterium soyangense TaxID=2023265 RepID=A0A930UDX2_9FLAO|nr:T9SS type A sorting domain-containing protein [Flavobacterium soyangense]MBF2708974.1 T9SS type A sorting domain-containing protein [Flavobacterium soyangense]
MKKQLFLWSSIVIFAQAPNISYPTGTQTFGTGTVITPLSPINTGGAVPATIYGQVGSPFVAASFSWPSGVSVDSAGNVYVADYKNNKIRKITPLGVVTTFAGSGIAGSADGIGMAASFNNPTDVIVDSAGNVYVADSMNNRIRKITPAGVVTTFAGSGTNGFVNGIGTSASFNNPYGVAVDSAGNVYVADSMNNAVRKITSSGVVTTLAVSFNYPTGVSVDTAGNVYVADYGHNQIQKITSTGIIATFAGNVSNTAGSADGTGYAASFNGPADVAVDSAGNVYVADQSNNKVRKISPAGVVTTLAGSGVIGAIDGTGTAASFYNPSGVAVDSAGNVYVADRVNDKIRKITPAGVVATLAGDQSNPGSTDGLGTNVSLNEPLDVTVDSAGNVYVADTFNNRIRKISLAGVVTTLAGSGIAGTADGTGIGASFKTPTGVAVDLAGNVYVADVGNQKIRKITPVGLVTTFAGTGIAGAADGTGTAASFYNPSGVAVDSAGNVYIADQSNNKVRKITVAGVVTTLAGIGTIGSTDGTGASASFKYPYNLAVDAGGNVYVADAGNNKIRKITPAGVVTTLAGSGAIGAADDTGTAASFYNPLGVTVDSAFNVYVADTSNRKIRKITPAGVVTTVAGSGVIGATDDTGAAASFFNPSGVEVDFAGNVYVADRNNYKVRKILATGYTIAPVLAAGLNFDNTTGIISGTPTVASVATSYTVTAYNVAGSSSATVVIATTTLGITTFNKQVLKLYPNPANSFLDIQTPNNTTLDKVCIIDLTGKKVLEQTQNTSQVDVAHLANGMYIIEAFSGEEKFSSKFMKE